MALSWAREEKPIGMIADRSLYLDKSEQVVVEEGDPRSAYLLISKGREIPPYEIDRLGLLEIDGRVYQKGSEPRKEPEMPRKAPPAKGR